MVMKVDYNSEESMLAVKVNHMWRTSAGIDLAGQIKIRQCRVARLVRLKAPSIIMDTEVKKLNALLRKQERERNG